MEHMDTQQPVRDLLLEIMGRKGLSYEQLGQEIGVATGTAFFFLCQKRKLQVKTLYKVNQYIKDQSL